jgi:starch synthase (maltosyl-transferring)
VRAHTPASPDAKIHHGESLIAADRGDERASLRFDPQVGAVGCFGWLCSAVSEAARRVVPGFGILTSVSGSSKSQPTAKTHARPVIEDVTPSVDMGLFAAKRELGDDVVVEADVFADGHDLLACELRWRHQDENRWSSALMHPVGNDRWRGTFRARRLGAYRFSVRAAVDEYGSWARDLGVRVAADQDVAIELVIGGDLAQSLAGRALKGDGALLDGISRQLRADDVRSSAGAAAALELASAPEVLAAAQRCAVADAEVTSDVFTVNVDRARARFGSWYEMFPRSASPDAGRHGTLRDVAVALPYVGSLGFDVLYLPPIHPIGDTNRKGRDGSPVAQPGDPGSPWAIGADTGGHLAIHPELGDLDDFDRLVEAAANLGIEIALDLAFQCSPDHPWVTEHPDWFKRLPDGTVRYAENPPKRYEDIYPIDFDTSDWGALWDELAAVVRFWISHGVRIFRVDNPHTKPLRFWEWLISSVKADDPDVLFLSEAFTRPKIMNRLAKVGFTQSYTYFAWRTAKWELEQYLDELHRPPVGDFLRPNLWPNTPDILTEQMQAGGRATFMSRLVLAATLASSYGIYGPGFELQENRARSASSEEYLHSEKYEIRLWNRDDPKSLGPFISVVNKARRDNQALQHDGNLRFHHLDNDHLMAYSRHHQANTVLVVVNLDPQFKQSGWVELDLDALGIDMSRPYTVNDVLTGARYTWKGSRNFVSLDPREIPAHIFRIETSQAESGSDVPEGSASGLSTGSPA